ncbi:hypothetical protein K438DRAFT_1784809 [Mycena galopus ATCC 62051]|nr:hypothetical protein K438DRAFT_1784809 [Mycena galopus ATCC 62051]
MRSARMNMVQHENLALSKSTRDILVPKNPPRADTPHLHKKLRPCGPGSRLDRIKTPEEETEAMFSEPNRTQTPAKAKESHLPHLLKRRPEQVLAVQRSRRVLLPACVAPGVGASVKSSSGLAWPSLEAECELDQHSGTVVGAAGNETGGEIEVVLERDCREERQFVAIQFGSSSADPFTGCSVRSSLVLVPLIYNIDMFLEWDGGPLLGFRKYEFRHTNKYLVKIR